MTSPLSRFVLRCFAVTLPPVGALRSCGAGGYTSPLRRAQAPSGCGGGPTGRVTPLPFSRLRPDEVPLKSSSFHFATVCSFNPPPGAQATACRASHSVGTSLLPARGSGQGARTRRTKELREMGPRHPWLSVAQRLRRRSFPGDPPPACIPLQGRMHRGGTATVEEQGAGAPAPRGEVQGAGSQMPKAIRAAARTSPRVRVSPPTIRQTRARPSRSPASPL